MFKHAIEVLEERVSEIEAMKESPEFVDNVQNVIDMEKQIDDLEKAILVLKDRQ